MVAAGVCPNQVSARRIWGGSDVPSAGAESDFIQGIAVGRDRVHRWMQVMGLNGRWVWKYRGGTLSDHHLHGIQDHVQQKFTVKEPGKVWVADTDLDQDGRRWQAIFDGDDGFGKSISVSLLMVSRQKSELVVLPLAMVLERQRSPRVIHHSDQGLQYSACTNYSFGIIVPFVNFLLIVPSNIIIFSSLVITMTQNFNLLRQSIAKLVLLCLVSISMTATVSADQPSVEKQSPVTIFQQMEDTGTTFRISNYIKQNQEIAESSLVNVTTVNGVVLLTGSVPTAEAKKWVENLAYSHPFAREVVNELRVSKVRTVRQLIKDKYIQVALKAKLTKNLQEKSPTVHVTVAYNTAYLMGVVDADVVKLATDIASNQRSVDRVITIFELKAEKIAKN